MANCEDLPNRISIQLNWQSRVYLHIPESEYLDRQVDIALHRTVETIIIIIIPNMIWGGGYHSNSLDPKCREAVATTTNIFRVVPTQLTSFTNSLSLSPPPFVLMNRNRADTKRSYLPNSVKEMMPPILRGQIVPAPLHISSFINLNNHR